MQKTLIIGIYARVSTEEQAKHGYSIDNQISQCKEQSYKDHPNEEIQFMLYVDNGFSGEFMERPKLQQLLEDVSLSLINEVYCYDPDRLARKLMHQLLIDEKIAKYMKLNFVNGDYEKTPEGILFFQLRGAIAQFEKAKINERMSSGRKTKAKKGKVVKDNKIYGYSFNRETDKLTVNEAEATVVRFIFDAFLGKIPGFKGINGIALYLTEKQVPTKKGADVWHRQVVRQILMQKAYTGEFSQNKWDTEGMLGNKYKNSKEDKIRIKMRPEEDWITVPCPVIIDAAEFKRAQDLLSLARKRWAGTSKNNYLLSGLLRCKNCENTMTGRKTKNWGRDVFEYIDLKSTAGYKNKGCGFHIRCEVLDDYVWEKVYETILRKFKEGVQDPDDESPILNNYNNTEIIRLTNLLESKDKARKQFIKSVVSGSIVGLSETEINEALLDSQKEVETVQKQLEDIENKIKQQEILKGKENLLQDTLQTYLMKHPEELTFEDKKQMIRLMVREVQVYKDIVEIYGFD